MVSGLLSLGKFTLTRVLREFYGVISLVIPNCHNISPQCDNVRICLSHVQDLINSELWSVCWKCLESWEHVEQKVQIYASKNMKNPSEFIGWKRQNSINELGFFIYQSQVTKKTRSRVYFQASRVHSNVSFDVRRQEQRHPCHRPPRPQAMTTRGTYGRVIRTNHPMHAPHLAREHPSATWQL